MPTTEQLATALRKADAAASAGDQNAANDARKLAAALKRARMQAAPPIEGKATSVATAGRPEPTPWGDGQAFDDMYAGPSRDRNPNAPGYVDPLAPLPGSPTAIMRERQAQQPAQAQPDIDLGAVPEGWTAAEWFNDRAAGYARRAPASNPVRDAIKGADKFLLDWAGAGMKAVDPQGNMASVAEQFGHGVGAALTGPDNRFTPDLPGMLEGFAGDTARNPVSGATTVTDLFEPTHWVASGVNDLGEAGRQYAAGNPEAGYQAYMEATPKILGGAMGVIPGSGIAVDAGYAAAKQVSRVPRTMAEAEQLAARTSRQGIPSTGGPAQPPPAAQMPPVAPPVQAAAPTGPQVRPFSAPPKPLPRKGYPGSSVVRNADRIVTGTAGGVVGGVADAYAAPADGDDGGDEEGAPVVGAGTGAAAGFFGPRALGRGLGRAGRAVRRAAPIGRTGRAFDESVAASAVRKALQSAGVRSSDEAAAAMAARYGDKPASMADLTQEGVGMAANVSRQSGRTGELARARYDDLMDTRAGRLERDIGEASPGLNPATITGDIDRMVALAREAATPAYNSLREQYGFGSLVSPRLDEIRQLDILRPHVRSVDQYRDTLRVTDNRAVGDFEYWDLVKRSLDDTEQALVARNQPVPFDLDSARRAIVEEVDRLVPNYAAARELGGEAPKMRSAFKEGGGLLGGRYTSEDVGRLVEGVTGQQITAMQAGVIRSMIQKTEGARSAISALTSPGARQKLAAVFGPEAAEAMQARFMADAAIVNNASRINPNVGSVTAQAQMGGGIGPVIAGAVQATRRPLEAALATLSKSGGYSQAQRDLIGEMLLDGATPENLRRIFGNRNRARGGPPRQQGPGTPPAPRRPTSGTTSNASGAVTGALAGGVAGYAAAPEDAKGIGFAAGVAGGGFLGNRLSKSLGGKPSPAGKGGVSSPARIKRIEDMVRVGDKGAANVARSMPKADVLAVASRLASEGVPGGVRVTDLDEAVRIIDEAAHFKSFGSDITRMDEGLKPYPELRTEMKRGAGEVVPFSAGKVRPPPGGGKVAEATPVKPRAPKPPVSNGVGGSKPLPMDEGSRMQRAYERFGDGPEVYHWSDNPSALEDGFVPFSHFGTQAAARERYVRPANGRRSVGELVERAKNPPAEGATIPARINLKKVLHLAEDTGDHSASTLTYSIKKAMGDSELSARQDAAFALHRMIQKWDDDTTRAWAEANDYGYYWDEFDGAENPAKVYDIWREQAGLDASRAFGVDVDSSIGDAIELYTVKAITDADPEAAKIVLRQLQRDLDDEGITALSYTNEAEDAGSLSYIVPNPKNIRGRFAAFDPSQEGSSKLLAGIGAPSGNSFADNLKQDAAIVGATSIAASANNPDDPKALGIPVAAAIIGGKYGSRAIGNKLRSSRGAKASPGKPRFNPPAQQTFAGINAKTADRAALARAEQMAKEGASRDEIWDETGWFKGVDGKWRFEIDDRAVQPKTSAIFREKGKLGDFVTDADAQGAYPQLNDLNTRRLTDEGGAYGKSMHDPEAPPSLAFGGAGGNARNTVLHERQHAVQDAEGFASGGSPTFAPWRFRNPADQARWDDLVAESQAIQREVDNMPELLWRSKKADEVKADPTKPEAVRRHHLANAPGANMRAYVDRYKAIQAELDELRPRAIDGEEVYHRLAGETEARNVQTRRNLSPGQRRKQRPWETQDVPDDQQIVRFGGGKAESRPKPPPSQMGFTGGKGTKPPPPPPGAPGKSTPIKNAAGRAVVGGALGAMVGGDAQSQTPTAAEMADVQSQMAKLQKTIDGLQSTLDIYDNGTPAQIQEAVSRGGEYTKPDGIMGPDTVARVKADRARIADEMKTALAELDKGRARIKTLEEQEAFEQTRPNTAQQAWRQGAPWIGALIGIFAGGKSRSGAVKEAHIKALEDVLKANKLLTPGPIKKPRTIAERDALKEQPARINQFWREGGAGDNVPFDTNQKGDWIGRPKAKVATPSSLYPQKSTGLRANDYAWIAAGLGEAGLSTIGVDMAHKEIAAAQAALEQEKSKENYERLERAHDILGLAEAAQRFGFAFAGYRAIGAWKKPYKTEIPDIKAAEAERVKMLEYLQRLKK